MKNTIDYNLEKMTTVIFAGGLGTRMQEETEYKPKPMVLIGGDPILLWVIRNYAKAGVKNFIILLGYKGEVIDNYFSLKSKKKNLNEYLTEGETNHIFEDQGKILNIKLLNTGQETLTAGRLLATRKYFKNERFFCTYGDAISNISIKQQFDFYLNTGSEHLLTVAQQRSRFGEVTFDNKTKLMTNFEEKPLMKNLVNIGYFIFSTEIFTFCESGKMLEESALSELSRQNSCAVYCHNDYWQPVDTLRDLHVANQYFSENPKVFY